MKFNLTGNTPSWTSVLLLNAPIRKLVNTEDTDVLKTSPNLRVRLFWVLEIWLWRAEWTRTWPVLWAAHFRCALRLVLCVHTRGCLLKKLEATRQIRFGLGMDSCGESLLLFNSQIAIIPFIFESKTVGSEHYLSYLNTQVTESSCAGTRRSCII